MGLFNIFGKKNTGNAGEDGNMEDGPDSAYIEG